MDTWEAALTARIGSEVKRLRGKRTAAWLAERATELGLKMTRQTIADLENGRRRYITLAELTVLSAALDTSPLTLVYPGPYETSTELLPGYQTTEYEAAHWFSGFWHWSVPDSGDIEEIDGVAWVNNTRRLRMTRELTATQQARDAFASDAKSEQDYQHLAFYDRRIEWLRNELRVENA